jgi:hypothetical protein
MFAKLALALLGAVSVVNGLVASNSTSSIIGRTCGSHLSASAVAAAEAHFAAHKITPAAIGIQATKTIKVYFHVVQAGTAVSQGAVTYVLHSAWSD